MAPRLSAPAITSARRTPGIGCSTTVVTAASHCPSIPLTSSLCLRTSESINGLLPIVPISTTSTPAETRLPAAPFLMAGAPVPADAPILTTGASCPVTRPTSWLKSPTALTTPGQSSPLTSSVAACPFAASTKSPCAGDVLTYFVSPSAFAVLGPTSKRKRKRKSRRIGAVLSRCIGFLPNQTTLRIRAAFRDPRPPQKWVPHPSAFFCGRVG